MDPLAYKSIFLGSWFALFFIGERLASAAPTVGQDPIKRWSRLARNLGLWVILALISPLIIIPMSALGAGAAFWTRPEWLGGGVGLALSILALDLFTYWSHRAYHQVGFMWRLHAPHHFDQHLDTTSAVRFHPGEVILSAFLRLALIVGLAVPFAHVVIFETVLLASAIFHHSNIALPSKVERSLAWIIVTPSHHWVHHHADDKDTNSNFASLFSIWDRLFGSKSPTKRFTAMPIGVEGVEDRSFLGLIMSPFGKAPTSGIEGKDD